MANTIRDRSARMSPDFSHVDAWVFDLDNTLYPADCALFPQIDALMTTYIQNRFAMTPDDARRMQKDYYVAYGTTMNGPLTEHDICPDEFLEFVHDIDLAHVIKNPELDAALGALPGRKFIFTNGSVKHAENVTNALGVRHHFNEIFDIKAAGYAPKPKREPYETFLRTHAINPERAAMFEDLVVNLEAPHALGMTTILVQSDAAWLDHEPHEKRSARPGEDALHIDYITDDIAAFLTTANASATKAS